VGIVGVDCEDGGGINAAELYRAIDEVALVAYLVAYNDYSTHVRPSGTRRR
jgi:hypothetical protein